VGEVATRATPWTGSGFEAQTDLGLAVLLAPQLELILTLGLTYGQSKLTGESAILRSKMTEPYTSFSVPLTIGIRYSIGWVHSRSVEGGLGRLYGDH
jgi:hypothetical protein